MNDINTVYEGYINAITHNALGTTLILHLTLLLQLGGSDSVVYSNLVAVNDCMVVFKNKSPDGDHTSTKYAVNWLQAGLPRHVQKLLKEMIELQLDIDADINPDSQTSMEEGWLVLNAALSTDPPVSALYIPPVMSLNN